MPVQITVWLGERVPHDSGDPAVTRQRYAPGYLVTPYEWREGRTPPVGPQWGMLDIPDATREQVQSYLDQWQQLLDMSIVAHDPDLDGYRLRVEATQAGASLAAAVTREQVETWLGRWGAAVHSVAANQVTFDVLVGQALQSEGFWGIDPTNVGFEELNYDPGTGIHRLRVDYSARVAWKPQAVEQRVKERGGVVLSHADYVIEFTVTRTDVREQFAAELKEATERTHDRRRWRLSPAACNLIRDAPGRIYTATRAQVLAALHDGLED